MPVSCVRDLGIFIDVDLTMRIQVTQTCSKCSPPCDNYESYVDRCQTT